MEQVNFIQLARTENPLAQLLSLLVDFLCKELLMDHVSS